MKKIKLPLSKISFNMINVLIVAGMLFMGYLIFKIYQDIQLKNEIIHNYLQNSPVDKIETQKAREILEFLEKPGNEYTLPPEGIKNPFATLEAEADPEEDFAEDNQQPPPEL